MARLKIFFPNLLTIFRIVLMIPFIMAIANNNQTATIVIAIVIISTDYFDGLFARKWKAITDFGKILDPLADKICSASAAIALIYYRGYPLWLFFAILARDLIILIAGLILLKRKHNVPVSNISGKIAVGFISASLSVYLINFNVLKIPIITATVVALFISLISYARYYLKNAGINNQISAC